MSRHWVYVGPPDDTPDCWKHLPPKCRKCIYRKSEEANNYCPFPNRDCYPKTEEKRREDENGLQSTENDDNCNDHLQ